MTSHVIDSINAHLVVKMAGVDFDLVSLPMISLPMKETVDASFAGLKPVSIRYFKVYGN